jgi:hypothetical protein
MRGAVGLTSCFTLAALACRATGQSDRATLEHRKAGSRCYYVALVDSISRCLDDGFYETDHIRFAGFNGENAGIPKLVGGARTY